MFDNFEYTSDDENGNSKAAEIEQFANDIRVNEKNWNKGTITEHVIHGSIKSGGHRYSDGSRYIGDWNQKGQKHGVGHLMLADQTRYDGFFENGVFSKLGCIWFPDGAKYEGEFESGWFHGCGIFWRADGLKFEGEFRGGRIWGLGLVTFPDLTHGFPRNEGYFQDCRLIRKRKCSEIIQKSQKLALMARQQCDNHF